MTAIDFYGAVPASTRGRPARTWTRASRGATVGASIAALALAGTALLSLAGGLAAYHLADRAANADRHGTRMLEPALLVQQAQRAPQARPTLFALNDTRASKTDLLAPNLPAEIPAEPVKEVKAFEAAWSSFGQTVVASRSGGPALEERSADQLAPSTDVAMAANAQAAGSNAAVAMEIALGDASNEPSAPIVLASLEQDGDAAPDGLVAVPEDETASRLPSAPIPLPTTRPIEVARLEEPAPENEAPPAPDSAAPSAAASMPETVPLRGRQPEPPEDKPLGGRTSPYAIAYAKDEEAPARSKGIFGSIGRLFSGGPRGPDMAEIGNRTAVYDISTATVYMPDGSRLEAHSGLGSMMDDPSFVKQKNKGPTVPNVYKLVMRESLFHGVEAVRLLPHDGVNKYNRDGFLAHTYMLGKSGQSNGCLSFKDYQAFLKAFKAGKVNRMIVVPEMSKLSTYTAML
ncbi:hypothetical protein HDIA_3997 [Hartmannibacter diazotrophicus]|uniref:Tlde1 domain-containing protein n=1 Tax=Hartmannibacter diazotrophicus TaxID=1482074 RepID=A0A2C9DBN0_9HYPH|nr:DUF2778 domain-containing protein [Hartmannibacter diazotrophicus]SON57538.1 hypothetical protein HDIA_3997 [Hartmannibacter diazotrophicus]